MFRCGSLRCLRLGAWNRRLARFALLASIWCCAFDEPMTRQLSFAVEWAREHFWKEVAWCVRRFAGGSGDGWLWELRAGGKAFDFGVRQRRIALCCAGRFSVGLGLGRKRIEWGWNSRRGRFARFLAVNCGRLRYDEWRVRPPLRYVLRRLRLHCVPAALRVKLRGSACVPARWFGSLRSWL